MVVSSVLGQSNRFRRQWTRYESVVRRQSYWRATAPAPIHPFSRSARWLRDAPSEFLACGSALRLRSTARSSRERYARSSHNGVAAVRTRGNSFGVSYASGLPSRRRQPCFTVPLAVFLRFLVTKRPALSLYLSYSFCRESADTVLPAPISTYASSV